MSTLRQVITDKFIVIDRVHMSQGNLKIYHKKSYRTKNWIFIIGINENKILQKTMDTTFFNRARYNKVPTVKRKKNCKEYLYSTICIRLALFNYYI